MNSKSLKAFMQKSRLAELRIEASSLIKDTVEQLKCKYEDQYVSEQTLKAIAPLVEEGENSDVLLARLDFDFFCTQISPVFKPTAHHQVWNRALITERSNDYLHRIAGDNVSILAPRGASKSTKLGLFCAWAIGTHAEQKKALQMLYISANRELALAKSETIRNIIASEPYQKIFEFVQPHPKKWASPLWSIDREAAGIETTGQEEFTCIAAGILGTISSKRCFEGDTKIETNYGTIKIKDAINYSDLKVKSYNHNVSAVEYRTVRAFSESRAKGLVEITTSSGRSVSCTSDHSVYTLQQGYKEAGSLVPGDAVIGLASKKSIEGKSEGLFAVQRTDKTEQPRIFVQEVLPGCERSNGQGKVFSLREDLQPNTWRNVWKNKRWLRKFLLFKAMLQESQVGRDVKTKALSGMWSGSIDTSVWLQQEVLRQVSEKKTDRKKDFTKHNLSNLQKGILFFFKAAQVLLSSVFGQSSQQKDAGQGEQPLQTWEQLRKAISFFASTDFGTRQGKVCNVSCSKYKGGELTWKGNWGGQNTPHRPQSTKQCAGEFDKPVQSVSYEASYNNKEWEYDTISSVERASNDFNTVYDIEVEGNSNFFANGILVHNCSLVLYDDLIKNAEDIASPSVRRKIVRTHYSVVAPTLFPGGRIIGINTRYRPDDIHVTDFIPSKGWNVLEQSAIIPRRELIRLGNFKERSAQMGMDTTCLDEEEAIRIAREEETKLAITRLKSIHHKKEKPEGQNNAGKKEDILFDLSLGSVANNGEKHGFSQESVELSKQLEGLRRYGVTVRGIEGFKSEDEWESYLDEEVSYWEEMWSLEYLQGRRAADAASFVYQYQNKVERAEGTGIPSEHIKFGRPPAEFDYYCIGGDLATSKSNKADYTVFCLVGKRGSEYYVLDYWRGKVTGNLQKIEHILDIYENWADDYRTGVITPWRIALEKVAYQASISDDLTRELYHKRTLTNIVVVPTQLKGGKTAHMASITGAFANGLVIFNEGIEWGTFIEEIQGLGAHDDCLDALVIALQTLGVRRRLATIDTEEEMEKIRQAREAQSPVYDNPYYGRWV